MPLPSCKRRGGLTPSGQTATLPRMTHGKKKSPGSRVPSKQGPPLGLVIVLAVAGGVVLGSTGTYFLTRPKLALPSSAIAAVGGTSSAPVITMSPPPSPQYTPAPQPPGEVPAGKVWSVEHGHWHDAPVTQVVPVPAPPVEKK